MAGRIFVTGDTHGDLDLRKLASREFPAGRSLDKEDFVIICGDFGLVWDGTRRDAYWLDWLSAKPWTTLFVDGNHENHDMLAAMPVERWHGGKVHFVRGDIVHLMRGQVFELCGQRLFTMGGARSTDIPFRRPFVSWWPSELPGAEEYAEARANLDACGWRVDVVLTHCAPSMVQAQLVEKPEVDELNRFLQEVAEECEFTTWYFGHYHVDRVFPGGYICLYDSIRELNGSDWSALESLPLYAAGDVVWVAAEGALRSGAVERVVRAGSPAGEHCYSVRLVRTGELMLSVPEGQIEGLVEPAGGDDWPEEDA